MAVMVEKHKAVVVVVVVEVVEVVDMANSEAGHGTVINFAQLLPSNKMLLLNMSEKIFYIKFDCILIQSFPILVKDINQIKNIV